MSQTNTWDIQIEGISAGICQWITDNGGTHEIDFTECYTLVQAWLHETEVTGTGYSFIPVFNDAYGVVQYWLKNYSGGNTTIGCGL
jgi:hypothetical protein